MPTKSSFYSLEHMGTASGTVSKITPPVGSYASSERAEVGEFSPQLAVGEQRHSLTFFSRVARVQRQIESLQAVSDADLLQHAADLTQLMEQAWDCFITSGNHFAYDKALKHLRQRDAARRLLSREWQERREAEILAGCSAAFFVDQGDKARAQIAANEEKAA